VHDGSLMHELSSVHVLSMRCSCWRNTHTLWAVLWASYL